MTRKSQAKAASDFLWKFHAPENRGKTLKQFLTKADIPWTRGEWSMQGVGDNWWITSDHPVSPRHVGTRIASVFSANPAMGFDDSPSFKEAMHNARLLTEAPKMAKLLAELFDEYAKPCFQGDQHTLLPHWERVRTLLAHIKA